MRANLWATAKERDSSPAHFYTGGTGVSPVFTLSTGQRPVPPKKRMGGVGMTREKTIAGILL